MLSIRWIVIVQLAKQTELSDVFILFPVQNDCMIDNENRTTVLARLCTELVNQIKINTLFFQHK